MGSIEPKVSVEYAENATIVTFVEQKILEEKDIQELQGSLGSVIDESHRLNLILDFANVQFLSSAVLGLLIRVSKKIYEREGRLRLCNINRRIYEVFKITRLTNIFEICSDREDAIQSLAEE